MEMVILFYFKYQIKVLISKFYFLLSHFCYNLHLEIAHIPREKISFIQLLGEGAFGRVFLGKFFCLFVSFTLLHYNLLLLSFTLLTSLLYSNCID